MKKFTTSIIVSIFLFNCKTTVYKDHEMYQDFEEAPLIGMVYDLDNRPVANLEITFNSLDINRSRAYSIKTDVNGRFSLIIKRGNHQFITNHPDYLVINENFNFTTRGQMLYIKVKSVNQLLNLAAQALQKELWHEAKDILDEISLVSNQNPLYLFYLATYYYSQKEYILALEVLEIAHQISKDPVIIRFLIKIHEKLENVEDVDALLLILRQLS